MGQAWLDGPEGGTDGQMDGRTNKQTNVRKISPFYRTLFPIGAAALPPPMKTKEKVELGKGTADHLMPLGYLFSFHFFHTGRERVAQIRQVQDFLHVSRLLAKSLE